MSRHEHIWLNNNVKYLDYTRYWKSVENDTAMNLGECCRLNIFSMRRLFQMFPFQWQNLLILSIYQVTLSCVLICIQYVVWVMANIVL